MLRRLPGRCGSVEFRSGQKPTLTQPTRAPAVPALPGVVCVGSAWMTTDAALALVNTHGTVLAVVASPCASVLKSSQISLAELAKAGSTDGLTGSGVCWKCGPAASPVGPQGMACACAP